MPKTIIPKRCGHCKIIRPTSEFYKDETKPDELHNSCKSCCKNYRQNEKGKAVQKRYRRSDKGKANQKRYRQREPEKIKLIQKRYRQTEKGKSTRKHYSQTEKAKTLQKWLYYNRPNQKARIAVNHAVRDGKLPRPDTLRCFYGKHPAQQYHHWHGYEPEHWLDVVPVCVPCDRKEHLTT